MKTRKFFHGTIFGAAITIPFGRSIGWPWWGIVLFIFLVGIGWAIEK